jgi:hypothetical protein
LENLFPPINQNLIQEKVSLLRNPPGTYPHFVSWSLLHLAALYQIFGGNVKAYLLVTFHYCLISEAWRTRFRSGPVQPQGGPNRDSWTRQRMTSRVIMLL